MLDLQTGGGVASLKGAAHDINGNTGITNAYRIRYLSGGVYFSKTEVNTTPY